MSRSIKDLRELICVSRLTVRNSDDDDDDGAAAYSDEEEQIVRAFSRLSSYAGDYRPESVIYARTTSKDSRSPDSGIGTNGQSPEVEGAQLPDTVVDSLTPHPPASRRSGAARRRRKRDKKLLATVPAKHDLPRSSPLPPVPINPFKPTDRPSQSSSEDEESQPLSSSESLPGRSASRLSSTPPRTNFDDILTYMDATIVGEWLTLANEQVGEMSQWIHIGDNFVEFAHFWLSNFPAMERQEIFHLEHGIIIDHLQMAFAAGRDAGKVQHRDLLHFMEAVFHEYPAKLLSSKGPHLFLDYLDTLTSERRSRYKALLADVKCSTRIKQYAQWTLAVRAFTLVSIWVAVVNFHRRLLSDSSRSLPLLKSTIDKEDPSMDRMYHAIRAGHVDVVHYYLASGKVSTRSCDEHGRTLVFTAVMHNQPEVLSFLLKKVKPRPDINLSADTGNSPLHAAANSGEVLLVTTLLRAPGLDVDSTNPQCENATPLHLAVMHGHRHVVEVLLVAGADRSAKMGKLSALDIARDFGHTEILEVLQKDIREMI